VTPITSDWSPDGTRIAFVGAGAEGEVEEVFVVSSSGDGAPSRVTFGAGAQRARWVSNEALLVSGLWGSDHFELREVLATGGPAGAALVGIDFGSTRDGGQFDISRDREWVAYSYGDNVGDIWVLEGRAGHF
jgi:tricorn protease-like protein